ncbi:uncharacterized protein STEHIDRAFT_153027 [Stereum hirsutum FP-91666 SS1]|uniref:uncharacterized protein n=1 Tax=Stereum hirsutum (strain FP-91666) TaxID=721885 RepID=UPI000440AFB6|nr:uncharacterized protein STEHIDRAFT_153027 [Stereum hirsutum FP-91666 SS1]EIM91383.1 hypothetical protein STEHIDRAFT_153027 [Stereum hirsutum FP-91666 SS1]
MPKLLHLAETSIELLTLPLPLSETIARSSDDTENVLKSAVGDNQTESSSSEQKCRLGEESKNSYVPDIGWDIRRNDVKVPLRQLWITAEQKEHLSDIYATQSEYRKTFIATDSVQAVANTLLTQHGLDYATREQLESRWKTVWSTKWKSGDGNMQRVLLQCACGYNTDARQHSTARRLNKNVSNEDLWTRHAPYDFTGCLAHADITFTDSNMITRIVGYFDHNESCQTSSLVRYPAIPIHPHVLEVALAQLADGANIRTVQKRNTQMCEQRLYRDQLTTDPLRANFRYELSRSDYSRLHRRHHEAKGIDIDVLPQYNVDEWLQPGHPNFKPTIYEAVFHYSARTSKSERFEVCICTPDMEDAAWSYTYESQMILDGTFGVASSRLLLFIAMSVDEERKGVPIALFLFSAPTGNRATHAGYDTKILTKLLTTWKEWMTKRPSSRGRIFAPATVITDTDTKERGALNIAWPGVILLLCKFHVRQCWTNKRTSLLGKRVESVWKSHVQNRLRTLENALLASTTFDSACALIVSERSHLSLLQGESDSQNFAVAGLAFLSYMEETWMNESLWRSWSQCGRNDAAARLGIPVEGVLPTTNHLESFNGVLKNDDLSEIQHAGRRLRFDVLIFYIISYILPLIFAKLRVHRHYLEWRRKRFSLAAGNIHIPDHQTLATQRTQRILAWYSVDVRRDSDAQSIVDACRLIPVPCPIAYELWATCATSFADTTVTTYPRYWLSIHSSGAATCTCPDWLRRGGACKHLRAFRIVIQYWITAGQVPEMYLFPSTYDEALDIQAKNEAWYGEKITTSITSPISLDTWPQGYSDSTPPTTMIAPGETIHRAALPPPHIEDRVPSLLVEQELESLATGADDDEGLGPTLQTAKPELSEGTNTQHECNSRAIMLQVQSRIDHEVAQLLPRLHGLATLMGDAIQVRPNANLLELREVLQDLTHETEKLTSGDRLSSTGETASSKASVPQALDQPLLKTPPQSSTSLKRSRESQSTVSLMPPSPEAQQKRKKSFGFL